MEVLVKKAAKCEKTLHNEKSVDENTAVHTKYFTSSQKRRQQRKKAALLKKNLFHNSSSGPNCETSNNTRDIDISYKTSESETHKNISNIAIKEDRTSEVNSSGLSNLSEVGILSVASNSSKIENNIKMEQNNLNKSRDEVKATREEKKRLKQLVKAESKSKIELKSKTDNLQQKDNSKDGKLSNNCIDSPLKKDSNEVLPREKLTNEKKNVSVDNVQNSKENQPESQLNNYVVNTEKSREEIKAEREAKKLAKQMSKNKLNAKVDSKDVVEKISNMTLNSSTDSNEPKTPKKKEENKIISTPDQGRNDSKESEKSKSALKAERRAKQEAQRAAKAMMQSFQSPKVVEKNKQETQHLEKPKIAHASADIKKSQSPEKSKFKGQEQHKVKLFDHLYIQRETNSLESPIPLNSKEIHPAIVRLGVQYASHIVMGSNARCIALLNALKQVISDYNLPPNVEFSRGLEAHFKPCIKFLESCRLPAVSMKNALKHIQWQLRHFPNNIAEYDAKMRLQEAIDTYVREQIEMAGQAISMAVRKKISDGDVILTYGCSSLIEQIITEAADEKRFRVVIVTAHPWNEGRELLRRLTGKGVKCSLIMISALSFVMREINKVLLGAGALLANGYVMARAGTAQVAMVAHAHNVPVLVCCETHKFTERVQTDSIVYNEIGNPDDLINCDPSHKEGPLANWRINNNLTLLNLTYDVTPPDLVTAVVTELAILPCTSVPVILRIKPSEFSV